MPGRPKRSRNPGQRQTVHLPVDNHPRAVRQRDLHPPRRRGSPRDSVRRRPRPGRFHNHRNQSAQPHLGSPPTISAPPGEKKIGVDVIAPRHNGYRYPGLIALRDNPKPVSLAPPTTTGNRARRPRTQFVRCVRHLRSCPLKPCWTPQWCPLPIAQPRLITLIREGGPRRRFADRETKQCYVLFTALLKSRQPLAFANQTYTMAPSSTANQRWVISGGMSGRTTGGSQCLMLT